MVVMATHGERKGPLYCGSRKGLYVPTDSQKVSENGESCSVEWEKDQLMGERAGTTVAGELTATNPPPLNNRNGPRFPPIALRGSGDMTFPP